MIDIWKNVSILIHNSNALRSIPDRPTKQAKKKNELYSYLLAIIFSSTMKILMMKIILKFRDRESMRLLIVLYTNIRRLIKNVSSR